MRKRYESDISRERFKEIEALLRGAILIVDVCPIIAREYAKRPVLFPVIYGVEKFVARNFSVFPAVI
jgi:hypothetical protein